MTNHSRGVVGVIVFLATVAGAQTSTPPPSGRLNVRNFGAKGDGITDDSKAIQSAIDTAARQGKETFVPAGTFVVANLIAPSHTHLIGEGMNSVLRTKTGATEAERSQYLLSINPGTRGTARLQDNTTDVSIKSVQFLGTVASDGFAEHKHLLNINAATNVLIESVGFTGFRGDGIYLGSGNDAGIERHNSRIVIRSCRFDGINNDNRNAITIIDGHDVVIEKSVFVNCTRSDMPGPIDVEPNASSEQYVVLRSIVIRNNTFSHCGGNAAVQSFTKHLRLGSRFADFRVQGNFLANDNRFNAAGIWVVTGETKPATIEVADNCALVGAAVPPIALTNVAATNIVRNHTHSDDPGCVPPHTTAPAASQPAR